MEHVNAEILRAIADGKTVQYRNAVLGKHSIWENFDVKSREACWALLANDISIEWRIAPKGIRIGDVEVPEPCREAPTPDRKFCWVMNPFGGTTPFTWTDDSKGCRQALEGGFVHLTEEAAEKHYEAFKNLLAKK